MKKIHFISLTIFALSFFSCSSSKKNAAVIINNKENITSLKLIGQYIIPDKLQFQNTTVGGLSGIDYDPANGIYYIVSDDRSEYNPARFYTARIFISLKGIDSLQFIGVHSLLQPNGTEYPGNKADKFKTPDPEAMRYNSATGKIVWSSEGERIIKSGDTVLLDPAINFISTSGQWLDSFRIPENLKMSLQQKGPRQNGVFEGLTFADNYKTLYVNVEEPLYEDGPRVDVRDTSTFIRILKFDTESKQNTAQFAYKPNPVAYSPIPSTAFKINGIPDILSLGGQKLLVTERSYSSGRAACTIKVFIADLSEASDIKNIRSLRENVNFKPVSKKLLLNFDSLGIYVDNVEGATFGPVLPDGHRSMIFIADNNFSSSEKSQIFLFEVN